MKRDFNDRPPPSAAVIAQVISRYQSSGLALKDFARQESVPPGRLHYWLYQKHRAGETRALCRREAVSRPPDFQEVKLAASPASAASWAAEVSLPEGGLVRFSAVAPPGWIGQVVQALQRPCGASGRAHGSSWRSPPSTDGRASTVCPRWSKRPWNKS